MSQNIPALARIQLSLEQWEEAWEQGYAMSLDQAVVYALQHAYTSIELGGS
jgi:hypothetical protein